MYVVSAYICICSSRVGLVPVEVIRCQILRPYMISPLIWMLGIKSGSCVRAVSVVNHEVVSPPTMELCFMGIVQ